MNAMELCPLTWMESHLFHLTSFAWVGRARWQFLATHQHASDKVEKKWHTDRWMIGIDWSMLIGTKMGLPTLSARGFRITSSHWNPNNPRKQSHGYAIRLGGPSGWPCPLHVARSRVWWSWRIHWCERAKQIRFDVQKRIPTNHEDQ